MLITSLLFFISISLLLIFSKARHKIDTRKNLEKSRKIYEFFFCKFYLLIPKRRIKLDKTPSIHRPNFENMMGNLFLIYAAFSCFINKRTQYWMQGNTARQTIQHRSFQSILMLLLLLHSHLFHVKYLNELDNKTDHKFFSLAQRKSPPSQVRMNCIRNIENKNRSSGESVYSLNSFRL